MGGNGSRESADQSGISREIPKTFFIRQICKIFPKSSASDLGSVFCQHTFWQLKPLTRTKQTNQRRVSLLLIIKCLDNQKLLQSGSSCYGFSDYHHLDRLSPIHHTAGTTTMTAGFLMQHIFCTELLTFFLLLQKQNQVRVMRLS